jgi:tetratricopeptide (TPR) repeat protein
LSKTTGVNWIVDGVPYSDDAMVAKCLTKVITLVSEGKNLDAAQEIERCRNFIMAPKERMIFLNTAGNCHYVLGNLRKAKEYYEDVIEISGRSELEKIYKEDALSARAAGLGNIGLIYLAKGELDEALKYHKDALKIDKEIGYKQGEASDLGNIGLIYSAKGELDEALKYHKDALKILNQQNLVYGRDIIQHAIELITNEKA